MNALVLEAYHQLTYKEVPLPEIRENEVLVRIKATGICGSDVHGMDGSSGRRIPPVIMGHEAAGIIERTGEGVAGWKAGDRVTFDSTIYRHADWYTLKGQYNLSDNRQVLGVSCKEYKRDGTFAEFVSIPEHILYKIPESVSYSEAALTEPLSVAAHALSLTPVSLDDTAIVIGAGMIGLSLVLLAKNAGFGKVICLDIEPDRLKLAESLGADYGFNALEADIADKVLELTHGRGADVTFEAVGIETTLNQAIELTRKGGGVTLLGNVSPAVRFPLQSVVTRQIRIQGSCAIAGEYPVILDMLDRKAIDVSPLISKEVPLKDAPAWFEKLYHKEKGLIKVMLLPEA